MTARANETPPPPSPRTSRRGRPRAGVLLLFFAVLSAAAGCDHASKQLAISALSGSGGLWVWGGAVRLELVSNPGAFLNLGVGLPEAVREVLFLGLVPLFLLGLCLRLLRSGEVSLPLVLGLGLVAGGGLGNWGDRLLHGGRVTDFVTLVLGPLHTGVFNVADVAIVAGVALLAGSTVHRARSPGARSGHGDRSYS